MGAELASSTDEPSLPCSLSGRARQRLRRLRERAFGAEDGSLFGRDAATAFAIRILSAAILYLSQVLLARWIGGHDYGIYVTVWSAVLALSSLTQLGFNTALIRLLPEYRERGETNDLRGLLLGSRLLAVTAATLVALSAIVLLVWLGPASNSPYVWPAILILACLPMCALSDVQDGIGRGQGWLAVALAPPYILRPLLVLLVLFTARMLGLTMEAATACIAAIVATWSATLVQLLLIERRLASTVGRGPRRYRLRSWLAISLPLLAIAFADVVLQTADVLVISRFLPPDQVAIYFAAAKTMSLVMFVHYAVGSAVARHVSMLNTRGDRARLQREVQRAVHWTFWPSLAATVLILAAGWPLLWMFGPRFTDAYPAMVVLAAGFLIRSSFGPAEFLLNMQGEQRVCAIVLASAAALSVVLNLILVPVFGILGAATATAFAISCGAIANGLVARRRLGLDTFIGARLFRAPASER
jgi:O-antigen/teichoic acid export membrane protein